LKGIKALTDVSLIYITGNCGKLQSLYTSNSTDVSITQIVQETGINLLHLGVFYSSITEASIEVIAQHCSELTLLDLLGCIQLADNWIITLAMICTQLVDLALFKCTTITNDAIIALP
jgi:hypothetical protein